MNLAIGIVIPTYQAAKQLPNCLTPLLKSSLKPRVLVIDSSSTDGTPDIATQLGAEVLVIPQSEFDHGMTRERGRRFLKTPIVVMVTQDAYATSPDMLEKLIQPLIDHQASIAYARQIPHLKASIFASFHRHFNYPPESHSRSIDDVKNYGAYTFFCSNSCAAYLNSALDEIGGFSSVLFGEETIAVAKLLHRGHKISYVAEAEVRHSHDYTLREEFHRHFDMGLARNSYGELLFIGGSDHQRGKAYVKSLMGELWKKAPFMLPYALIQSFVKFSGYHLGKNSSKAPIWWKKLYSGQKHYWNSFKRK